MNSIVLPLAAIVLFAAILAESGRRWSFILAERRRGTVEVPLAAEPRG